MISGFLGMIPHAAILICNMYIVFFLIDRVNTAMCFIDNDITKCLLMIMCVISMFTSISLIRAQRKAEQAIHFLALGGQHNHRRHADLTNIAAYIRSAAAGHHDVEDHQIGQMRQKHHRSLRAGLRRQHLIGIRLERRLHKASDICFILHDKDLIFIITQDLLPPFPA